MKESLNFQSMRQDVHEHFGAKELMPHEKLKEKASLEVTERMMSEWMQFEPTQENKIMVLRKMIAEYGATEPGTNIPLDNSLRFHAEAAAQLLKSAEETLLRESSPPSANAAAE